MAETIRRRMTHAVSVLLGSFCLLLVLPASHAKADPLVRLRVSFSPDRLNASTTIHFGFRVGTSNEGVPPPLTGVSIRLPRGMGLGMTTLGEAVCPSVVLERSGTEACPSKALMGIGHAVAELPLGNEVLSGPLAINFFMGTPVNEQTGLLFDAVISSPVAAQFIFHGALEPEPDLADASIKAAVPLISTWPEGPVVSVVDMESTLGPEHLTYYSRIHGRRVAYHPIGMAVPARCPAGGFRFTAFFTFQDGTTTTATSAVPCPG